MRKGLRGRTMPCKEFTVCGASLFGRKKNHQAKCVTARTEVKRFRVLRMCAFLNAPSYSLSLLGSDFYNSLVTEKAGKGMTKLSTSGWKTDPQQNRTHPAFHPLCIPSKPTTPIFVSFWGKKEKNKRTTTRGSYPKRQLSHPFSPFVCTGPEMDAISFRENNNATRSWLD